MCIEVVDEEISVTCPVSGVNLRMLLCTRLLCSARYAWALQFTYSFLLKRGRRLGESWTSSKACTLLK